MYEDDTSNTLVVWGKMDMRADAEMYVPARYQERVGTWERAVQMQLDKVQEYCKLQ